MKFLKTTFKLLGLFILSCVIYVVGNIIYGTATDYVPTETMELDALTNAPLPIIEDSILTLMTWNIGYGGLGEESDFFYADGNILFSKNRMVRPSQNIVEKNVNGTKDLIKKTPADFYLFQEIDEKAKRSYSINQITGIQALLPDYASYFAINYKVAHVPTPICEPWQAYGHVISGLGTFSKYQPIQSTRYQLPGIFGWPNRLYLLDRCTALHRYTLKNGKELVIFNIHNSAYDKDGSIKKIQMEYQKKMLLEEYQKGNYVIAGGDWNQCPPGFLPDTFRKGMIENKAHYNVSTDFMTSDWQWAFDPLVPTSRNTNTPYDATKSFIKLIDYFLVSPNIKVLETKGINLDFKFSDHQPVMMKIQI